MSDLLIHNLAEVATARGSESLCGAAQSGIHRLTDTVVLCRDGEIAFVGPTEELDRRFGPLAEAERLDGRGGTLEHLVDLAVSDQVFGDGLARRASVALFDLLGQDHDLTREYRRRLAMALHS